MRPSSQAATSLRSTLPSIEAYLKDDQHTVSFLFSAAEWIDQERRYIRKVLDCLITTASSAQADLIDNLKYSSPNIYPVSQM